MLGAGAHGGLVVLDQCLLEIVAAVEVRRAALYLHVEVAARRQGLLVAEALDSLGA